MTCAVFGAEYVDAAKYVYAKACANTLIGGHDPPALADPWQLSRELACDEQERGYGIG